MGFARNFQQRTGKYGNIISLKTEHHAVLEPLRQLKKEGFTVVGLMENGQINISRFSIETPLVVVVGSENKGLSLLTQKNCDYLIKIPLKGKTSSLNASVAAAISLHQLTKRFFKET